MVVRDSRSTLSVLRLWKSPTRQANKTLRLPAARTCVRLSTRKQRVDNQVKIAATAGNLLHAQQPARSAFPPESSLLWKDSVPARSLHCPSLPTEGLEL